MHIALIGYGEVGQILAEDLRARGHTLTACDVEVRAERCGELRTHAEANEVAFTSSHRRAVEQAELVISAVTADQTVAAAEACSDALAEGAFFLDFNSASPSAKIAAAKHIARGKGRYVEGAVMASVPPYRVEVPILLGGPHATALSTRLDELGFLARVGSSELGIASATKMCRSVVVKGMEAMLIEGLTAARHYGVEQAVLASLAETFPAMDWDAQADYFFRRVIAHGRRRSEEMREAARTVREAGLEPWSASATASRQAWIADHADTGLFEGSTGTRSAESDWRGDADRILASLRPARDA